MMSIKIKNDFDGSNPTAEMPKISFSCGLDKSTAILIQSVSRLRCLIFAYFTDFFIFFIHSTKDKSLP